MAKSKTVKKIIALKNGVKFGPYRTVMAPNVTSDLPRAQANNAGLPKPPLARKNVSNG